SNVVDELAFFNQTKEWIIEPGLEQITRSLIEQLPIAAKTMSEVTGFECENGKVTSVTINAQDKITGDYFIFTPSSHWLIGLVPNEGFKPANRSRLAKQEAWTAVTMALKHPPMTEVPSAIRVVL